MRFFISGICLDCPVVYSGLYRSISQCSVQGLHNSTSTCPRPTGLSGERWRVREVENGMWGCVWPNTKGSGSEWGAASVSLSLLKTRLGLEPTETVYWLQPGGIQRCREREREVCVSWPLVILKAVLVGVLCVTTVLCNNRGFCLWGLLLTGGRWAFNLLQPKFKTPGGPLFQLFL